MAILGVCMCPLHPVTCAMCTYQYFLFLLRLLLSIDRRQSISEAQDTVYLAAHYSCTPCQHHARVVGIDLSGDPNVRGLI